MASIAFEGVTKVFPDGTRGRRRARPRGRRRRVHVLVGPSGSGKSTALRMVAGLEDATGGHDPIGDRVVNDVAPKDRDIAMVFQSYALYPHMSVDAQHGLRAEDAAQDKRVDRRARGARPRRGSGIGELLGSAGRRRSRGGQRQRVALGRAIVREPQAFLMDEPLSNLDAKLRVEMRAYIARLHQELGTTTLYVTHDQIEAMTMGDRVAVMRDGRLEQVDAPQALYEQPGQPVRRRLHRLAGDEPRARSPRAHATTSSTWSSAPSACTCRAGSPMRCSPAATRRSWWGSGPRRCPTHPPATTTTRCSRRPSSSSSRWDPTCWSMPPSTLRRCSPRTSSKSRARLAETRLPTSCALASPRACRPTCRSRRAIVLRLHVDMEHLHFFDPDTTLAMR